jgi:hypothetical protein
MKEDTALRWDFRARRATRIRIDRQYLLPGYRLIIPRKAEVTPTGQFVLFRLRPPKGSDHPALWARWDNAVVKGRPGPAVKIELDHSSARERLHFKHSLKAYAGHWPVPEPKTGRFHISIIDRGTPIFRGLLSLRLVWAVDFSLLAPGEVTLECFVGEDLVAEVPFEILAPLVIKALQVEKRLRRRGQPARVARRLATLATTGLIDASALTIRRPDLLPRIARKYTEAETPVMVRRLIRRFAPRLAGRASEERLEEIVQQFKKRAGGPRTLS